ncbi:MAG: nucleotidyltransferase domain-containing protein [Nitrospirota bacterium]
MLIEILKQTCPEEIPKQVRNDTFRVQNDSCRAFADIPVMLNSFQHLLENQWVFSLSANLGLLLLQPDYEKILLMAKEIISVEEIRNKLAPLFENEGLQLVVLFGSAVSERIHKQSDIDIALLFDRPIDIFSLTNKVIRLLRTNNIDVIDLRYASPLLKFIIAKSGRLLYEREQGIFNEFYSLAFRRYVDTKKLRDAQETAIKHFLKRKRLQ